MFPFVDAEYGHRYYISGSDLFGVYAWKSDTAQSGVAIDLDPTERRPHDDARLRQLPAVKDTARLKLFASQTFGFVTVDASIATDILGRGHGTTAQANLWATLPLGRNLSINAGPGADWTDGRSMRTFFAVTPRQAAASPGLFAFSPHAGLLDAHMNLLAEWQFLSRYRLGVQASIAHLKGDAADSPITRQRTQRSLMGWVAYTFR